MSTDKITPDQLRGIRKASGLGQTEFWSAIGVKQPAGSTYEQGRQEMPDPVRRMVALHYIAGIPTNAPAEDLARIGEMAQAGNKMRRSLRRAENLLTSAAEQARQAAKSVGGGE